MGPSLDYLLSNPLTKFLFRKRLKELILKEMPKHIAMMHAQGIRHNHLHFRNITIYRGKPTFIDFSISENVGRRFISTKDGIHIEDAGIPENYEELATKFMPDYIWPIKDFVKFFGRRELKEFITNLYNAYPLKKDKTSLEQFIRRLSENTIIDYY
jgi:hypothetical protein